MTYEYVVLRSKIAGMYYVNTSPYAVTDNIAVAEAMMRRYARSHGANDPLAIYFRVKGNPATPWTRMAEPSEFECPT